MIPDNSPAYDSMRDTLIYAFKDRYDFTRGDMRETPDRYIRMLSELTTREEFNFTTFPAVTDEMIVVGPINFVSLCAHHIIPFIGDAWVAYVPNTHMAGLSKLARTVRYCAAGLSVQEVVTADIVHMLENYLDPLGVAVTLRAEHLCMTIRGVQSQGTKTTTTQVTGVFADHTRTAKAEYLQYVSMNGA